MTVAVVNGAGGADATVVCPTAYAIKSTTVAADNTPADKAPTPQLCCIYTVSLLDTNGAPIGVFYRGPSLADTGS
ncbi:MAG: hypothetical protein RR502_09935 [Oscillospiraceae bacterium]